MPVPDSDTTSAYEARFADFVRSPYDFAFEELQRGLFCRRHARAREQLGHTGSGTSSQISDRTSSDDELHPAITTIDITTYSDVSEACLISDVPHDTTHVEKFDHDREKTKEAPKADKEIRVADRRY